MQWKGWLSTVKIAICGPIYWAGSSSVPTFRTNIGWDGGAVARCVQHSGQKRRVTGFSMSLRVNRFGSPFSMRKPSGGTTMK